jgi:hypothetical protein
MEAKWKMPTSLAHIPLWYARMYSEYVEKPKLERIRQMNDPNVNLAKVWRERRCMEVLGLDYVEALYPKVDEPKMKKSKRLGNKADIIQQGESYPAPFDLVLFQMRTKAVDEPGLLAGSSATDNLPQLTGGICHGPTANYICWRLHHRVDLDRVHLKMVESGLFATCEAKGSIGRCSKIKPWQHMNPSKQRQQH